MYTTHSFLCKPFLHSGWCTVCFVFIIKKSNNLAVYLHWLGFDPVCTWMQISNMCRCWSCQHYQQLESHSPLQRQPVIWRGVGVEGEEEFSVWCLHSSVGVWRSGQRFVYWCPVKCGWIQFMKSNLNNEKVELNLKLKEPNSICLLACFSQYLPTDVAFSIEHRSQETAGLWGQNKKSSIKNGTAAILPLHTTPAPAPAWLPWGQWCQAAETALNQRAPFGSSHVEKIRPIFSFQGTDLRTQKVTASRSMAMMVYIPIKQKTRKARVVLKLPTASWPCK